MCVCVFIPLVLFGAILFPIKKKRLLMHKYYRGEKPVREWVSLSCDNSQGTEWTHPFSKGNYVFS